MGKIDGQNTFTSQLFRSITDLLSTG